MKALVFTVNGPWCRVYKERALFWEVTLYVHLNTNDCEYKLYVVNYFFNNKVSG